MSKPDWYYCNENKVYSKYEMDTWFSSEEFKEAILNTIRDTGSPYGMPLSLSEMLTEAIQQFLINGE